VRYLNDVAVTGVRDIDDDDKVAPLNKSSDVMCVVTRSCDVMMYSADRIAVGVHYFS